MAKQDKGPKVPKKIMGFKLSKGTRKDLKKLMRMFEDADTRTLAMTAVSGLAAFLASHFTDKPPPKRPRARPSQVH
jgi:hypothetical protein